jgi:hypothetical protein
MSLYNKSEWKKFRDELIELDGYKCKEFGRSSTEVILQVHHKNYIKGRLPWEYPLQECETLCKGCHSSKHGITKPQIGWEFVGEEDLGDLNGTCENCGASIRHSFLIQHENWGAMEVGTFCCDKLTDTNIASNLLESQTSFKSRKQRFLSSKRWNFDNAKHSISQGSFKIEIVARDNFHFITIHGQESKKKYDSVESAKEKVFDVIESGEFLVYLDKHKIPFSEKKKRKTKDETEKPNKNEL